ncbi:unnamed protein product [Trichobilharzia regenti]|nr:unnamed protein product [Trichobilharzia regenti]
MTMTPGFSETTMEINSTTSTKTTIIFTNTTNNTNTGCTAPTASTTNSISTTSAGANKQLRHLLLPRVLIVQLLLDSLLLI